MSTTTIYANLQCEFCGKILANKKSLKTTLLDISKQKNQTFRANFAREYLKIKCLILSMKDYAKKIKTDQK